LVHRLFSAPEQRVSLVPSGAKLPAAFRGLVVTVLDKHCFNLEKDLALSYPGAGRHPRRSRDKRPNGEKC
jgi:hypothetical protein